MADTIKRRVRRTFRIASFPSRYNALNQTNSQKTEFGKAINIISNLHPNHGELSPGHIDVDISHDSLTIIIPVYNLEEYLKACLDSILNQETDYEYIIHVIDDGSTDGSLEIANNYAARYHNIKVSHQENASQSVARNNALDQCDTEWVMMVDGDDILPQGAIQSLMDIAITHDCDVVEGQVDMFYGKWIDDDHCASRNKVKTLDAATNPDFVLTSRGYSCGKVYRRELWNKVRYPERYIFEDIITKFVVCRKANRYARTNQVVYGYRARYGSSSHSGGLRKLDCLWVMDKVQEIRKANNVPNDGTNHLLMMNHFGILTPNMVASLDPKVQQAAITIAKDYLVRYSVDRKKLPYFFRKSYDAIMAENVSAWIFTFQTIVGNKLLINQRELN